jgi:hypothetical protein
LGASLREGFEKVGAIVLYLGNKKIKDNNKSGFI